MIRGLKNLVHYFLALGAVIFYKYPAKDLLIIGVTGTDGKTTTSHLIYEILKKSGKKAALISTVAAYIGASKNETGLHVTTPNPWRLQELIKKAKGKRCEYLVLEVTSHGLDQNRLLGCNFFAGVLTNVTHEHLDYHGSFDKYLKTKTSLLERSKFAFLNKDAPSTKKVLKYLTDKKKILFYSEHGLPKEIEKAVETRFNEDYNRQNASAAVAVAKKLEIKEKDIINGLKGFEGVPGRKQEVKNTRGVRIYIDFAHTPNALKKFLENLSKETQGVGRIVVVVGSAGERDKCKRSMMGEVAAKYSDFSVFTAEDPRSEDENAIIEKMAQGAQKAGVREISMESVKKLPRKAKLFARIPERGEAIFFAVRFLAQKGDTVAICGKGHEKSMSYMGVEYPWSDEKAVVDALKGKVKKIRRT